MDHIDGELLEWKETRHSGATLYCLIRADVLAAPPKMYKTISPCNSHISLFLSRRGFFWWDIGKRVDRLLYCEQEIGRPETRLTESLECTRISRLRN